MIATIIKFNTLQLCHNSDTQINPFACNYINIFNNTDQNGLNIRYDKLKKTGLRKTLAIKRLMKEMKQRSLEVNKTFHPANRHN